jgi:branched-subunit amino acid aminotransferase/4-amino-4-deoxychorismate lyase
MTASVPLAYLNGRFLPQSEAHLTLHDAGFVLGATATDLCRTFGHRLFRLPDHLRRFRRSWEMACIPQPLGDADLARRAEELAQHNATLLDASDDLALVLFATPGPVGYYLGEPGGAGDGPPTFGMHTFPLPFARYTRLVREGARLMIPDVRHVSACSVDPRIKQRSRLHWWLAEQAARQREPGSIALLLDEHDHVTETAGANFLLIKDGTVFSPPRRTILDGVSLRVTEELCGETGIPFVEKELSAEDCCQADEAMLTSTPYCMAGVRSVEGVPLTFPGAVSLRLLEGWNRLVQCDIQQQILRSHNRLSEQTLQAAGTRWHTED